MAGSFEANQYLAFSFDDGKYAVPINKVRKEMTRLDSVQSTQVPPAQAGSALA